jgi:hypothetical protein
MLCNMPDVHLQSIDKSAHDVIRSRTGSLPQLLRYASSSDQIAGSRKGEQQPRLRVAAASVQHASERGALPRPSSVGSKPSSPHMLTPYLSVSCATSQQNVYREPAHRNRYCARYCSPMTRLPSPRMGLRPAAPLIHPYKPLSCDSPRLASQWRTRSGLPALPPARHRHEAGPSSATLF